MPSTPEPLPGSVPSVSPEAGWVRDQFETVASNIEQAIRGKDNIVRQALLCLLAEGHLLIEDVPGVGKTSLAWGIAASIEGSFKRIQFTPDLLPADVTGVTIYNQSNSTFEFHEGAVFANVVVGDEINRASPKTQSALLEVMEEYRVTVDAKAHPVPRPFMVVATQNPIDMDGTYSLPEAQLDRFLMRLGLGYPDEQSEIEILSGGQIRRAVEELRPVVSIDEVKRMIQFVDSVTVSDPVKQYIVGVVAATRDQPEIRLGASPRGSLALIRSARAAAAAAGRDYVVPEDVKLLAPSVLSHRMILTAEAELQGRRAEGVVEEILAAVPIPESVTV